MTGDKDDSRSLHITVHKPSASRRSHSAPLLSGRFVFDDHIRCMAAKQRLTKGRLKARQRKMQMIARLLEMPTPIIDALYQPGHSVRGGSAPVVARAAGSPFAASAIPGRAVDVYTCGYCNTAVVRKIHNMVINIGTLWGPLMLCRSVGIYNQLLAG